MDALTRGVIQDELIKIWSETHQTVFMITHDVDEAILLADRILLMTNGPKAKVAESVAINIPRPRNRADIIDDPNYYKIRNYLVNFLVTRSGQAQLKQVNKGNQPTSVDPTAKEFTVDSNQSNQPNPQKTGAQTTNVETNSHQTSVKTAM